MHSQRKVVISDYEFPSIDHEKDLITATGAELVAGQCETENELVALARDADVILNQYTQITASAMAKLEKCKGIVRYGIGVDTVDIPAATQAGIMVCNVPHYGIHEVSDHAIALLMGCIRKIPYISHVTRNGTWDCNLCRPIRRITGCTLGFAGFGNIPRMMARKLAPWDLKMLVYDPYVADAVLTEYGVEKVEFEELLQNSDFISSHLPLTAETQHQFSHEAFAKMKKGSIFINTARGGVVDEEALAKALGEGHLAGAGLDVMIEEPPRKDHPLFGLPNLIVTPHAAWYSEEAGQDLQRMAAEEAARIVQGEAPLSCINPEVLDR